MTNDEWMIIIIDEIIIDENVIIIDESMIIIIDESMKILSCWDYLCCATYVASNF